MCQPAGGRRLRRRVSRANTHFHGLSCRAWLPKWGLRLSPTQRDNRKQNLKEIHRVLAALKQAAAAEPPAAQAAKRL